jgi:hypothetical protein
MAVVYRSIGALIVAHLQSKLSSTVYYVTQHYSETMLQREQPVTVCVLFQGFRHNEVLGETGSLCRDLTYRVGITAAGAGEDAQETLIDAAISAVEVALNPGTGGHGGPIFGNLQIERAFVASADKAMDQNRGIFAVLDLAVRTLGE